jgi:hypothetical protein
MVMMRKAFKVGRDHWARRKTFQTARPVVPPYQDARDREHRKSRSEWVWQAL